MSRSKGWKNKAGWIRFFHWEYWSFNAIYFPVYPVFLLLCLRARSFFFFAASNPGIENGGFLGESKKDIYKLVPADLQPRTLFFPQGADPVLVLKNILASGFTFPMIGKPNIGGRGRGIKKLSNAESLVAYVQTAIFDFHIQEFIVYPREAGIFFYKVPGQLTGHISGFVDKQFLKVTGDGNQNVHELLLQNPRGILQLTNLKITDPDLLKSIPEKGVECIISPYGNHARGALFLDHTHTVTPALESMMNDLCSRIPDFYFGRLDIRYESRLLLEQGKFFSVIEVNGAGSEPTHIYDPRHSIFFAWKEIIRHWIILFKVSRANHRVGHRYLSISDGLKMFKKDRIVSEKLKTSHS